MQNAVLASQPPLQSINSPIDYSTQSPELGKIPPKRFHGTAWRHILEHPRFKSEITKSSDNDIVFRVWTRQMEQEATKRCIKNDRITKLHNWKGISAPVSISIDLTGCPIQKFLFALERNPCKMRSLIFTFYGTSNGYGLGTILFYLTQKQTELQNLSLSLHGNDSITKGGANFVRKIILKNLPNLRNLELSYYEVMSTNAQIISSQITKRLTNLKSVFLDFGSIKLEGNETLPCIARDIAKNMPNLEKLIMRFWGSSSVSNREFQQFVEQICRNLTKLDYLHLNFLCFESLGSASLKALSKEICENLLNLRTLILFFDSCPKITKSKLDTLKNELSKNLPKLQYLYYRDDDDAPNELKQLEQ